MFTWSIHNMQGTNILGRLENDYRGQMTEGKMFRDSRIETNIVGETSVMELLAGQYIHPVGGNGGDSITKTIIFKGRRRTHDPVDV